MGVVAMGIETIGSLARVIRAELTHASVLTEIAAQAPETVQAVRPRLTAALDGALGSVGELRAIPTQSVHVEVNGERLLGQVRLMAQDVASGGLPRADRFQFAEQFLSWIPGA